MHEVLVVSSWHIVHISDQSKPCEPVSNVNSYFFQNFSAWNLSLIFASKVSLRPETPWTFLLRLNLEAKEQSWIMTYKGDVNIAFFLSFLLLPVLPHSQAIEVPHQIYASFVRWLLQSCPHAKQGHGLKVLSRRSFVLGMVEVQNQIERYINSRSGPEAGKIWNLTNYSLVESCEVFCQRLHLSSCAQYPYRFFFSVEKKLQQTSTRTVGDGLIADHHRSQKGRNPRHLSEVPLCLARKPPGKTNEITIVISYIYIYSMYTVYCKFITCCTYSVHILPYWKTTHLNVTF